tara:strand:+ start:47 stop:1843 length:1797 start_codon:yes stop_codon:yes gene_type:complete
MTEHAEFFGFSSEAEIKRRRAEMLLTLSPSKTKTLDDVAHNLNEDVEDYKCSEYERDLFYYDAVGQPVFEDGNDSWRAVLTEDVRFNRAHYISSKKMCDKASCRSGGRHKCKCPLLPAIEAIEDDIRDIVCDIVVEAFSRIKPNEVDEEMLEELAAAEIAEEEEEEKKEPLPIDDDIIELFAPVTSAMSALENDKPIWKPEGRWPADMMAEHDVNVALKEDHHVQRDVTHKCDCCKEWKYIASNIGGKNTCKGCNELPVLENGLTLTVPDSTVDKGYESMTLLSDETDDEDAVEEAHNEFGDHVLKLMVPGNPKYLTKQYLTTKDEYGRATIHSKHQIHHAVSGLLQFECVSAKSNHMRKGSEVLLFRKSHADTIVANRLDVIKERAPAQRNPVIAILPQKSAPALKKAPVEEPAPKKKRKIITKKKKKKVTNNVDFLTDAIVGGGTQVYKHELGKITIKANGKRGRTIYCCPEENCEHHDHNFQRVDSLIRHLHEKHNYDVLDEEGNIIPRHWHVCVHPDCMKKCERGIKGYHNTNQYIAHMFSRHQRRIVKTLNAEGKQKKSKKGYSMWHVHEFPKCTVERYRRDCAPTCQCWGAQ